MRSAADLHVHSKYSDRPSEWFLRRIGAPESFTEPVEVYEKCRAAGMDFVTITDHNSIAGALEIAHLPGTFLSSEVTTYFPEDRCKIHCLVLGITEAQHREIDRVRKDIYEFRDYLLDEGIVHSVAHPLFRVNDRLTVEHFERLIVLFKRFEGINGARDARASILARAILENLNPAFVEQLADRYDLDPRDSEPWRKHLTAGSDDHGGLYVASAYTETPPAGGVKEFLRHLAWGNHRIAGTCGSSLELARSFYSIAYRFYRDRLLGGTERRHDLFEELFSRLLFGQDAQPLSRGERLKHLAQRFVRPRKKTMGSIDRAVADELVNLVSIREHGAGVTAERRCFDIAARLSHQLSYASLRKSVKHLASGKLTESLQTIGSLAPVTLCIAPYLAAFQTQHKDEKMLRAVADHFPAGQLLREGVGRKVWFTDTIDDVNGVAQTVATCARLAHAEGRGMVVVTSVEDSSELDFPHRNFPPVGRFELPEYPGLELGFPPVLDILEYCEREKVSEIIVSTPGPLGLVGVLASSLFGVRLTGIYHTDFPAYVRYLTQSPTLERVTWSFMRWFFDRVDRLFVPSRAYLDKLRGHGFGEEKLHLLPRGVDGEKFGPEHRDPAFWRRFGCGDRPKILYVGRISREKNLDLLFASFDGLLAAGESADLIIVGDGPYLAELRERWHRPEVVFTGFLEGEELAAAYASADLFVFPSTTDTFGNVVLEALASGLPAVVSHRSGASEIVADTGAGRVVDVWQPQALTEAMADLLNDDPARVELASRGVERARRFGWNDLLAALWEAPATAGAPEAERYLRIVTEEEPIVAEL